MVLHKRKTLQCIYCVVIACLVGINTAKLCAEKENVDLIYDKNRGGKAVLTIKDTGEKELGMTKDTYYTTYLNRTYVDSYIEKICPSEGSKDLVGKVIVESTLYPVSDVRACCSLLKKLEEIDITYVYDINGKNGSGAVYADSISEGNDEPPTFPSIKSLCLKKREISVTVDEFDSAGFFDPDTMDNVFLCSFPNLKALTILGALIMCHKDEFFDLGNLLKKYIRVIKRVEIQTTGSFVMHMRKYKDLYKKRIKTLETDLQEILGKNYNVSLQVEKSIFDEIYGKGTPKICPFMTVTVVDKNANVLYRNVDKLAHFKSNAHFSKTGANFNFNDLKINFSKK